MRVDERAARAERVSTHLERHRAQTSKHGARDALAQCQMCDSAAGDGHGACTCTQEIYCTSVERVKRRERSHASGGGFNEPNLAKGESSAHCNALPRYWSFGGRSWKPRARDMFTAPSWGIKEADIEMGATIYRRTRAARRGKSHKLAPTPLPNPTLRGGGHPHPPRGVGEGTDGLREGPRQLVRTSGPVNLIADRGQWAQWVAHIENFFI